MWVAAPKLTELIVWGQNSFQKSTSIFEQFNNFSIFHSTTSDSFLVFITFIPQPRLQLLFVEHFITHRGVSKAFARSKEKTTAPPRAARQWWGKSALKCYCGLVWTLADNKRKNVYVVCYCSRCLIYFWNPTHVLCNSDLHWQETHTGAVSRSLDTDLVGHSNYVVLCWITH